MSAALPSVTMTIGDGAFGAAGAAGTDVHAIIGPCASGTVNTVYSYADRQSLVTDLTGGPCVEAAAYDLDVGGKPILVVPVNASIAGSTGTIQKNGGAQTDVTISAGTPKDAYSLAVLITKAGALGTARFKVALDGDNPQGPTYGNEIATSATYVVPGTGLTLGFASVTYVLNDLYTATCVAPGYTATDVQNAVNALLADPRPFRFLHLVGQASTPSGSAGIASALDTLLLAAETQGRFVWGLMQAPDDTDTNLLTAFASFSSRRVAVAAGFTRQRSVLTGRLDKRPAAWAASGWAARLRLSQDLGEVAQGRLPGVEYLLRDERSTPGLDAGGFLTLRTHTGRAGAFVNNPRIMAPAGSDYQLIEYRQVMDLGCTIVLAESQLLIGRTLQVNADGTIAEAEAKAIEATINSALANGLIGPGYATSASVAVDRTVNLLTTRQLKLRVRILPLGVVKDVVVDIAYANPKLVLAA